VIASKGYPEKPIVGNEITFPENNDIIVFHAGTNFNERNFVSSGGRVAVIIGLDDNLQDARDKVYNYIDSMKLSEHFFFRKDIGRRALEFINK
jgi:phosphoribosylamine--glycine ligase